MTLYGGSGRNTTINHEKETNKSVSYWGRKAVERTQRGNPQDQQQLRPRHLIQLLEGINRWLSG